MIGVGVGEDHGMNMRQPNRQRLQAEFGRGINEKVRPVRELHPRGATHSAITRIVGLTRAANAPNDRDAR